MKVKHLIEALQTMDQSSDVTVRTLERGEACLTVDLTHLEESEGCVLLVGDLDVVPGFGAACEATG